MANFADRIIAAAKEKKSFVCVGLDPRVVQIPGHIREKASDAFSDTLEAVEFAITQFNEGIIDAVADVAVAVKPQRAFYEQYGIPGDRAFERTVKYAKEKGLLVIEDAKRNDIGSTAEAYADGHIGMVKLLSGKEVPTIDVDAITVNAYLGSDGVKPFLKYCKEKGIFVLCKTSNPSSGEIQDLLLEAPIEAEVEETVFSRMGTHITEWGKDFVGESGYSSVGAVVGAAYPEQAKHLRKAVMPKNLFLVPGYGAQGATAEDITSCFNDDGLGAIVNSSREIIFAYQKSDRYKDHPEMFGDAAREAAIAMRDDIAGALKKVNKWSL